MSPMRWSHHNRWNPTQAGTKHKTDRMLVSCTKVKTDDNMKKICETPHPLPEHVADCTATCCWLWTLRHVGLSLLFSKHTNMLHSQLCLLQIQFIYKLICCQGNVIAAWNMFRDNDNWPNKTRHLFAAHGCELARIWYDTYHDTEVAIHSIAIS